MVYSSLHTHCAYSLDGVGTIPQWVAAAKKKELYGLAITDHGDCSSLLEIYYEGKKQNFPTMMGCEFYLINELGEKDYYHLTVLAKNYKGYQNLCRLSSLSFQREPEANPYNHFYKRPRITMDELFAHHEGLVICSGCLRGPLSVEILNGNDGLVDYHVKKFTSVFGDDYFLELQPSIVTEKDSEVNQQEVVNKKLLEIANKRDLQLVITPDAHMIHENQKILQTIKINNRNNKKVWDFDQAHYLFNGGELADKVKQHHSYLGKYYSKALENTNLIMDRGQFDLPAFPPLLPNIDTTNHPLYEEGFSDNDLLVKIVLHNGRVNLNDEVYLSRLKYEIDTLLRNGKINLLPYFLLIEDVVGWARKNCVTVGPGRGSASGSLLSYALGITNLDPIKFNLPFERFINKARIIKGTYPDIDLDFSDQGKIKEYVRSKYGHDCVAQIGVFQTLKTKAAIKDVLEFLRPKMTWSEKNALTSPLPNSQQGLDELEFFHDNLEEHPKLMDFMTENKDVYEAVVQLLGQPRQRGSHPCAMAISPKPLVEVLPLWQKDGNWVTQYDMDWCAKAGVIKYDFLSLNTLKDIAECIRLVELKTGQQIDPYKLPLSDPLTFDVFSKGDTDAVFQYHTPVAKNLLLQMDVKSLDDLALVTSLGRPGTMDVGMDIEYLKRRSGEKPVEYPHDALRDILKETYGIIVYQEQVMEAVKVLGGFTLEEADDVRRAMGKKDKGLLDGFKKRFVDYAMSNYDDIDINKANSLWETIQSFARYGFNRAHAYAYAMIGYICQYLKQYYPLEWYCAVFSNGSKDDRKAMYHLIKDKLVLPDINRSKDEFYIEDDKIISSLGFVEMVGERTVEEILAKQPFDTFEDFFNRVNKHIVRKDILMALIFAGAFESIEPDRTVNQLIEHYYTLRKTKTGVPREYRNLTEIDLLLKRFKFLPMGDLDYRDVYRYQIKGEVDEVDYVVNDAPEGKFVSVVGKIEKLINKVTKKGDNMAFLHLGNDGQEVKVTIWPEQWSELEESVEKNMVVQVWGNINIWNNKSSVILKQVMVLGS